MTSGAVSVSTNQATINPPSDLEFVEDTYVVVDAGCFRNADGDVASGNSIINTYNFTTEANWPVLGNEGEGGYLICMSGGNLWIVAPSSTERNTKYYSHSMVNAITAANTNAACGDWFVPNCSQMKNPGYQCRTYWDSYSNAIYWTTTQLSGNSAWGFHMGNSFSYNTYKDDTHRTRAFRCASY